MAEGTSGEKKLFGVNLRVSFFVLIVNKFLMGGAVAEWSKALQLREKINGNQKDPRFAPRLHSLDGPHQEKKGCSIDYLAIL